VGQDIFTTIGDVENFSRLEVEPLLRKGRSVVKEVQILDSSGDMNQYVISLSTETSVGKREGQFLVFLERVG
jgi:hypothetical protein